MINNRQNGRRRGRSGGPQVRGPNNGNDRGNRIDNRARGNAAQLHEKYKNLARDAQTQGDRVMTEYYLQFADHYFRVLSESRSRFDEQNPNQQRRPRYDNEDFDGDGDDGEAAFDGGESEVREPQQEQPQYRRDRGDREERGNQDRPERQDRGNQERVNQERGGQERNAPERSKQERSNPERSNRRERRDYREPVAAASSEDAPVAPAPVSQPVAAAPETTEAPRPRRGRPPRKKIEAESGSETGDASPKLEIDRLPPSFSTASEVAPDDHANGAADDEAPTPRRRRTRRVATSEDVAA